MVFDPEQGTWFQCVMSCFRSSSDHYFHCQLTCGSVDQLLDELCGL